MVGVSRRLHLIAVAILGLLAAFRLSPSVTAHDDPKHKHNQHSHSQNGQPGNLPMTAIGYTACVNGFASTFPCQNTDLLSFLPLADIGGGTGNTVWGWTDNVTGKRYALMGRSTGVSFVDVTNPEQPIYVANLPTHTVESPWRDIKVYGDYAVVGSEAPGHGMQILDLKTLRTITSPPVTLTATRHYNGFGSTHTLALNTETGFAYAAGSDTCNRGLHMVNIQDPLNPQNAGCVGDDGYTHETQCVVYRGPDTAYAGRELCFSSNEDTLTIIDVTDKANPVQLSRTGYANWGYAHQGWLTEDHKYFLMDDELDERQLNSQTRTLIWDVQNLLGPSVIGVYQGPSTAIDHNLYIRGSFAYQANYRSGLRVLDLRNLPQLTEVAYFDVFPVDDGREYSGAWSNYPFFDNGVVLVSGIEQGLFVLRPSLPQPPQIDVMLTMSDSPDPVPSGGTVTYTIGAANTGLAAASGVQVTNAIPSGTSLVSAVASQGTCSSNTPVLCALGTLSSGASATVTIVVRSAAPGTLVNTASVSSNEADSNPSNNFASQSTTVLQSSTSHIGDLDGSAAPTTKRGWSATVDITVHDAQEVAVAGATVSGQWTGGPSGNASCVTNSAGRCVVVTGNINTRKTDVTFTVGSVSHASLPYQPTSNHDPDQGSNGTVVTIRR